MVDVLSGADGRVLLSSEEENHVGYLVLAKSRRGLLMGRSARRLGFVDKMMFADFVSNPVPNYSNIIAHLAIDYTNGPWACYRPLRQQLLAGRGNRYIKRSYDTVEKNHIYTGGNTSMELNISHMADASFKVQGLGHCFSSCTLNGIKPQQQYRRQVGRPVPWRKHPAAVVNPPPCGNPPGDMLRIESLFTSQSSDKKNGDIPIIEKRFPRRPIIR